MKRIYKIIIISIVMLVAIGLSIFIGVTIHNKNITIAKNETETINNKKIYNTIISTSNYSVDPKNPENILAGINRHIIKVKVTSIGDAEFLPTTEYYNNPYSPCTPIEVEILENLYGGEINPINNKIYISGGNITLSNLCSRLDDIDIERMGLNSLSKNEKENQYMRFETEFTYDVKPGNVYTLVVADIGNNLYKIVDEGCGIFIENTSNTPTSKATPSNISLENVLTGIKIEKNTLVQKAIEKNIEINSINKFNSTTNKSK